MNWTKHDNFPVEYNIAGINGCIIDSMMTPFLKEFKLKHVREKKIR